MEEDEASQCRHVAGKQEIPPYDTRTTIYIVTTLSALFAVSLNVFPTKGTPWVSHFPIVKELSSEKCFSVSFPRINYVKISLEAGKKSHPRPIFQGNSRISGRICICNRIRKKRARFFEQSKLMGHQTPGVLLHKNAARRLRATLANTASPKVSLTATRSGVLIRSTRVSQHIYFKGRICNCNQIRKERARFLNSPN